MNDSEFVMQLNPKLSMNTQTDGRIKRMLGRGSCLSGFLTLFSSIGGSGMMALPYAFKLAGYGPTFALVIVGMGVNSLTCYILCEYSRKKGIITIDQLFKETFEGKSVRWLSAKNNQKVFQVGYYLTGVNTWVNYYGALIAYIIVVGTLFPTGLHYLGVPHQPYARFYWGPILTIFVILPLSTFKFKHVRFTSFVNFVSMLFSSVVILAISSERLEMKKTKLHQGGFYDVFSMFPIVLFAYTCQPDVGYMSEVLFTQQLASDDYVVPVVLSANFLWMVIFLLVGSLGYFSEPGTDDYNILNYSVVDDRRILAGLVRLTQAMISVCVALISCTPVLVFPIVDVAFNMVGNGQSRVSKFCRLSIIAGNRQPVIVCVALGIAISAYDFYGPFLGFVGAVSCSYVCVILPCVCYVVNPPTDSPNAALKYISLALIPASIVVFVASFVALVAHTI